MIIGLEIFSAQGKINDYNEIFTELNKEQSQFTLDKHVCEEIARTLLKF